jgi:hypothetical protein
LSKPRNVARGADLRIAVLLRGLRDALTNLSGRLLLRPRRLRLTPRGFNDATRDHAVLSTMLKRWPYANISLATGTRSGIAVLDIDPPKDGDESLAALEAKNGKLSETPTALTGYG